MTKKRQNRNERQLDAEVEFLSKSHQGAYAGLRERRDAFAQSTLQGLLSKIGNKILDEGEIRQLVENVAAISLMMIDKLNSTDPSIDSVDNQFEKTGTFDIATWLNENTIDTAELIKDSKDHPLVSGNNRLEPETVTEYDQLVYRGRQSDPSPELVESMYENLKDERSKKISQISSGDIIRASRWAQIQALTAPDSRSEVSFMPIGKQMTVERIDGDFVEIKGVWTASDGMIHLDEGVDDIIKLREGIVSQESYPIQIHIDDIEKIDSKEIKDDK